MSTEPGLPRGLLIAGIALVILGGGLFALFVVPHIVAGEFSAAAPSAGATPTAGGPSALWLAVLASGTGLAVGFGLIGIGLGHWKRPRPSLDGSGEV